MYIIKNGFLNKKDQKKNMILMQWSLVNSKPSRLPKLKIRVIQKNFRYFDISFNPLKVSIYQNKSVSVYYWKQNCALTLYINIILNSM